MEKSLPGNIQITDAYSELEQGVYAALEMYSNVHRGSGHKSQVSTYLFEMARDLVLEYLDLRKEKYIILFCTQRRAEVLKAQLDQESFQIVTGQDTGLSLGVRAMAVKRGALPKGPPFQTGGGTARLVSRDWILWGSAPDKFEAGTPAIVNIIAFAKALRMIRQSGKDIFLNPGAEKLTAAEILYHDELEKYAGRELLEALEQTLIGRDTLVPTTEGTKSFINLDYSASTPTFTPVWNAFCQTWRQPGKMQLEIISEVRSVCAEVLGAPLVDYDVIFTSNTTESINLVAENLSHEYEQGIEPVLLTTLLEHSSNDLPWRRVSGYSLIRLSVDMEGFIDLDGLDTLLYAYNQKGLHGKKRIKLVAVSGASNVLGTYNNLAEISRIVHRYGAQLLVDGAQLVAHRKVEVGNCEIDYFAFSAHKVYAPFGCGVLAVRKGLLHFSAAEMELIRSSGEENAAGITALGKALVLLHRIGLDLIQEEERALTGRALRGLSKISGLKIHGIQDPDSAKFSRKGGIIAFNLEDLMSDKVAKALAERGGIGVRYGCHCSHILIKHLLGVSPGLEKFQRLMLTLLPMIKLPGVVRMSLGIGNTEEDVDELVRMMVKIAGKSRTLADRYSVSGHARTAVLSQSDVKMQVDEFVRASALKVYSQLNHEGL